MLTGKYPELRMRRRRQNSAIRNLFKENALSPSDLILPIFVQDDGQASSQQYEISAMAGIFRHNIPSLLTIAEQAIAKGIAAIALFPYVPQEKKDEIASESYNNDNAIYKAIAALKDKFAEQIVVIADIALDPYTSHGHDGVLDENGNVANDKTIELLIKQALTMADAGADIIAPSDMMDGRIGKIRQALDSQQYQDKLIMAYSAKYASAFYDPFRGAIGSEKNLGTADKRIYQMDYANSDEAMQEIALDIIENTDIIMVKPALPYLDIIYRAKCEFNIPIFAYQVSGEYAMLKSAGQNNILDYQQTIKEALLSIKRAGADKIFTYAALDDCTF